MKLLLCALALLALAAPLHAQTEESPKTVRAPLPTIKLDSGIVITPVMRAASDLENILDVKMWQFQVQAPAPDTFVRVRLELRVPGKQPQKLGVDASDYFPEKKLNYIVGLAPVAGNSLAFADNWKTYYRTTELSGETSTNSGTTSSGSSNPLKDLTYQITRYGEGGDYALPRTNGDIPLATYYSTPIDRTLDDTKTLVAELVLVLTAKTQAK